MVELVSSMILGVAPHSGTFDINNAPKFLLSDDWNMTINKENSSNFMADFAEFQY